LTLTAAGACPKGKALTRAGASAGDLLYVSGTLGDARVGLAALSRAPRSYLAQRQKRPAPRIALGLVARRFASAAIDLSDGLGQDLSHLCRASKVGAEVALSRLPVSPALVKATGSREAAWREAAAGGEDYELLLAVPARRAKAFERAAARAGQEVTRVGEVTPGAKVRLLQPGGQAAPPPPGHDHFG
jgi:thiamine-monophosphate kinase